MQADAMHAAAVVQLQGALLCLLREASQGHFDPNDVPDSICVRMSMDGGDIEYLRGPIAVAAEGF